MANEKKPTGELFEFEPIKGFPLLNWRGKRPFRSTQYYPAQLRETHGEAVNGWHNEIYWGDNLQVMSHLLKKYRGRIKLVYIDPPFDSKADYKKKIALKGEKVESEYTPFEEKQYGDIWTNDEYLQYIYERLLLIRELICDEGSIYVHCDWHKGHHIRCVLDEVYGTNNFVDEIIWSYGSPSGGRAAGDKFVKNHDTILHYAKNYSSRAENKIYLPYSERYITDWFKYEDPDGRKYRRRMRDRDEKGNVVWEKQYLDESKGIPCSTVWTDVLSVYADPRAYKENTKSQLDYEYPTQKPEALVERIILHSSVPGDIVFDCFMGSGTTQAVALKYGRKYVGADINLGAIQTTTKRLIDVRQEISKVPPKLKGNGGEINTFYTSFKVFTVNHYDIFRNPEEAKRILVEAYGIQPLPAGSVFDGELDGFMVKLMPINRIATRADLNEIISNVDRKTLSRRRNESPGEPQEKFLLICMGHEPDLAAVLRAEFAKEKYDVEVKVADVLKDKAELEFKRESEAKIERKKDRLVIERFYPMNLLQKLSWQKKDVSDWRDLVDSVLIDWDWNGKEFRPKTTDIPSGKSLVSGEYPIPQGAKAIKVKITDLLAESHEVVLDGQA